MFCSKCGHRLEDDWQICPNCGNPRDPSGHFNNTGDPGNHSGYHHDDPGYQNGAKYHTARDSHRSHRPSPTTIMWGAFAGIGVLGAVIFGGMKLSSGKENPVDIVGDYYVTGCKDVVKVREGPDEDSNVLTRLSNGEKVSLVDKEDDGYWKIYIKAENIIGYMPDHYLTNEKDAVTEPVTRYVKIKAGDTMTIRSLPEEDANAVGILKRGQKVTLMADMSGDFDYIYAADDKTYGYVESSGLSSKKVSTASASTQAATPQPTVQAQPQPQTRTQPQAPDKVFGPAAAPVSHLGEYYVSVQKGYLALRNAKAFDTSNEIGQMNNGEAVWAMETSGTYWYVYSPSLGMYGYTNSGYLTTSYSAPSQPQSQSSSYLGVYHANVASGYLALRNDTAFDASNEIGQIANGAEVDVIDMSAGQYWYVYVPSLGQTGYVNSAYLR